MADTERWKVEVADAEIEEDFDSETRARARFAELVALRYDHELVKLYQIGGDGTQIPMETQRGHWRLSDENHLEIPVRATRVRAKLSKAGQPDVRIELRRVSDVAFDVIENGRRVGVYYRGLPPPRPGAPGLVYGNDYLRASDAFNDCIAKKYRGHTASKIEFSED